MPKIATHCVCCHALNLDKQPAVLMPFVAKRALGWDSCVITSEWGLRDVPLGHAHALCSTLHCPECGIVFLDMRFDDAEMARLYHDYRGPAYEALRESFEPGYAARNKKLTAGDAHIPLVEDFIRPWVSQYPAILDWGGDTGLNTPLRTKARQHHVLEISGKPLIEGAKAVTSATMTPGGYELIVLSNVLEHVPEPDMLIQQISDVLGVGRLYVEVPFESLMRQAVVEPLAWCNKRHWHEHINFFSEDGLKRLLARHGMRILSATTIQVPAAEGAHGSAQLGLICELQTRLPQ
jgi:hypothetical protein